MCHLYNFVIIYKHSNNPKNSIFKIGLFFVVIFSPFLGIFFFPTFLHIMFLLPKLFPSFYYQSILPLPLYFINPHPPFDTFSPPFPPIRFFRTKKSLIFFLFSPKRTHTHTNSPTKQFSPKSLHLFTESQNSQPQDLTHHPHPISTQFHLQFAFKLNFIPPQFSPNIFFSVAFFCLFFFFSFLDQKIRSEKI